MDTLTRMRAFIDVVEAQGFSAAARRTGRSKALLSKYVRELEDDLGALLLNRTTRQFSMTEAGHTYYRSAAGILKEIDNLADLVRESNADVTGRLRISVPRTFVDAEIGQSLIDFAVEHPQVSLEILADDRFVDLIEENFDLAIRITRLEDSGLIAKKLSDFRVHVVATPDFVARYGPLDHPRHLDRVPFIVDTNLRWHNNVRFSETDGAAISVSVTGPIEVNSPLATLRAAKAGLGIAMVPDFIAAAALRSGELVTLFDDFVARDRGIYAVFPHRRYLPAKVRVLVDFLAAWFRRLQDPERPGAEIPSHLPASTGEAEAEQQS